MAKRLAPESHASYVEHYEHGKFCSGWLQPAVGPILESPRDHFPQKKDGPKSSLNLLPGKITVPVRQNIGDFPVKPLRWREGFRGTLALEFGLCNTQPA